MKPNCKQITERLDKIKDLKQRFDDLIEEGQFAFAERHRDILAEWIDQLQAEIFSWENLEVVYSELREHIISGTKDGKIIDHENDQIYLVDPTTKEKREILQDIKASALQSIDISDSNFLKVLFFDDEGEDTFQIWDPDGRFCLENIPLKDKSTLNSTWVSTDNTQVIFSQHSRTYKINLDTFSTEIIPGLEKKYFHSIVPLPNGMTIFAGTTLHLYKDGSTFDKRDILNLRPMPFPGLWQYIAQDKICAAAYARENIVIFGTNDGEVIVFDCDQQKILFKNKVTDSHIWSIIFTKKRQILTTDGNGKVVIIGHKNFSHDKEQHE